VCLPEGVAYLNPVIYESLLRLRRLRRKKYLKGEQILGPVQAPALGVFQRLDDVEPLGDPGNPFVASDRGVAAVTSTVCETPSMSWMLRSKGEPAWGKNSGNKSSPRKY
jgi:hypothetical protein